MLPCQQKLTQQNWLSNNARDRQTNRQTYVGDSIIPAKRSLRGDKNAAHTSWNVCVCFWLEMKNAIIYLYTLNDTAFCLRHVYDTTFSWQSARKRRQHVSFYDLYDQTADQTAKKAFSSTLISFILQWCYAWACFCLSVCLSGWHQHRTTHWTRKRQGLF